MVPVWSPSSHQAGYPASLPPPRVWWRKGGGVLPLQCLEWAHGSCPGLNRHVPQANGLLDTEGEARPLDLTTLYQMGPFMHT